MSSPSARSVVQTTGPLFCTARRKFVFFNWKHGPLVRRPSVNVIPLVQPAQFIQTQLSSNLAFPKWALTPVLNKITKLLICRFKTSYLWLLFVVCNITNDLV